MAKKTTPLSFIDIVINADAQTIKQAYEAKIEIDQLLLQRNEAYQKINALETQIEQIIGDEGIYTFPQPPCPIAGFKNNKPTRTTPKKTTTKTTELPTTEPTQTTSEQTTTNEN